MTPGRILIYLVNFVFGLIALIIGLRIILLLFGANPLTPFVNWIYQASTTLLYPFRGIFPAQNLNGRFLLDISALVALVIYTLISYLIGELIKFVSYSSTNYYVEERKRR